MFGIFVALIILFFAHIKPILVLSLAIMIILRRAFISIGQNLDFENFIVSNFLKSISANASVYANSALDRFYTIYDYVKYWPWQTIACSMSLLIWFAEGYFRVYDNYKGVVLRLGSVNRYVGPGLHWHIPIFENYILTNVSRVKSINSGKIAMVTNDEGVINVNMTVFYKVDADFVCDYLFRARSPELIVESIFNSIIREVIANKKAEECLTTAREAIATEIQTKLSGKLNEYKIGIIIKGVEIGEINPSNSVLDSNRKVLDAQCEYSASFNNAEAYKSSTLLKAQGVAAMKISNARIKCQEINAEMIRQIAEFESWYKAWTLNVKLTEQMLLAMIAKKLKGINLTLTSLEGGLLDKLFSLVVDKGKKIG